MKRLLVQTQLSNYDSNGKFILECDSGWQMVMGRVREMLKLNSQLDITIMGPNTGDDGRVRQLITDPWDVNPDLWDKYGPNGENRMHYVEHEIIPNALVTRYDFDWTALACCLDLGMQKLGRVPKWDAVYINDPMHLRNFQALFYVVAGYQPRFYVHSHFIDNPECPKFPTEASLWLGQCEAAIKADFNFWQCESSMNTFFESASKSFKEEIVDSIRKKSAPWDDGYSSQEISSPPDPEKIRFSVREFKAKTNGKFVVFVPNRIGGKGRSSDYTNCGKFMFDILPELKKEIPEIIVFAGNPSQKFSNKELKSYCGDAYCDIVNDSLNRDEYKYIVSHSDVSVGLYDQDTYGGTAARECVDRGTLPAWLDNFEYSRLASSANYPFMIKTDFSNIVEVFKQLKYVVDSGKKDEYLKSLQNVIAKNCSYESTTYEAMKIMGILLCKRDILLPAAPVLLVRM